MVNIPNPINGSIGSRIRVVLGDTGNNWLLIENKDNGDRKWQDQEWKNIPGPVAKQLNNCIAKNRDIEEVDFGPSGSWYVNGKKSDGSGGYSWWGGTRASDTIKESCNDITSISFGTNIYNIENYAVVNGRNGYAVAGLNSSLESRIKRINEGNKKINFLRLFDDGQYFISDSEGTEWVLNGLTGTHCGGELKKRTTDVNDVAVAKDGSWIIICKDIYIASNGIDKELTKKLSKFYADQRRWISDRRQQIRDATVAAEAERLRREREEQEAREAAERAERERLAREAAEREERERVQREARERERAEREREEVETITATRISELEAKLEDRLKEEAKEIEDMETNLQRKKRSLEVTLVSMSPGARSRILPDEGDGGESRSTTSNTNLCVVCNETPSIYAIVPCGHYCLCEDCSGSCDLCPLCRGNKQSLLKIFTGR